MMLQKTLLTVILVGCVALAHGFSGEAQSALGKTDSPKAAANPPGADLYIGWASVDITPEKPVALVGQLTKRISQKILDPLTATVLALETKNTDGIQEQAIMISCDLIMSSKEIQNRLRDRVKTQIPDFNVDKLFMNATHTHTGPGFLDSQFRGLYDVKPEDGAMKASEYADFFLERVSRIVVEAWKNRKPGAMSWGLGHATIGHNRRAHYFNGTSVMYGKTDQEDFSNIEGGEDTGIGVICFWDADRKLTGMIVNVFCTSQEVEALSDVSADFWHDVRLELRKRYSPDLFVLPQCGTAGDQSPHLLYDKTAEEIMLKRRGITSRQEIARRIGNAVDDVFPLTQMDIQSQIVFRHKNVKIDLPEKESPVEPFYEIDSVKPIEFHVMRLGDLALATNPFELYLDYGIRIKARSHAPLTLLIQLSCQHSGYLPTERGVQGGGYSADKYIVGPEGGQVLVNETVKQINALWE